MVDERAEAAEGRRWTTRRVVVTAVVATVVVFGLLQLVPYRVTTPSQRADPPWDSPRTEVLFARACADCHSNRTRGQWYEHVAPVSWWIKGHIDEGRDELNIDDYPRIGEGGGEAAETVQDGSMPPSYYTWFGRHPEAELTAAERAELEQGLIATFGRGH